METKPHLGDKEFVATVKNTGAAPLEEAAVKAAGSFKYKLSLNGVPIGWLGKGGSQDMWAKVVAKESDAVTLEWYEHRPNPNWEIRPVYGIEFCLRIAGTGYNWMMTWSGGLAGCPVAFNTWAYASQWEFQACGGDLGRLIACDSKAPVSRYSGDSPWLYANAGYPDYKSLEFAKVVVAGA